MRHASIKRTLLTALAAACLVATAAACDDDTPCEKICKRLFKCEAEVTEDMIAGDEDADPDIAFKDSFGETWEDCVDNCNELDGMQGSTCRGCREKACGEVFPCMLEHCSDTAWW
jgi:hypothetical protein